MKVNAPEKLYLQPSTIEQLPYQNIVFTKPLADNSIEYIRADAFIEKAFEFFGEHLWEYIDVRNANCDTLINIDGYKLKEDFRNYMEGE